MRNHLIKEIGRVRHRRINIEEATVLRQASPRQAGTFYAGCIIIVRILLIRIKVNMMNINKRPLIDHWLWEPPMLKTFVLTAIGIPVVISCILFFLIGTKGLIALTFACFGPIFAIIYGRVGKRISQLSDEVSTTEGKIIPGLIVRGIMESAGVIVLGQNSLIIQPVIGKRSEVSRSQLASVREVTWFNGQLLIGKTGFWFSIPGTWRFACAVPNSYADDFRLWLSTSGTSELAIGG